MVHMKTNLLPHVHTTLANDLTPDQYLVTCDLGATKSLPMMSSRRKLTKSATYTVIWRWCSSPCFHHKIAYLICELNSTIEVLIYDGVGEFEQMQVISTLPDDYSMVMVLHYSSF